MKNILRWIALITLHVAVIYAACRIIVLNIALGIAVLQYHAPLLTAVLSRPLAMILIVMAILAAFIAIGMALRYINAAHHAIDPAGDVFYFGLILGSLLSVGLFLTNTLLVRSHDRGALAGGEFLQKFRKNRPPLAHIDVFWPKMRNKMLAALCVAAAMGFGLVWQSGLSWKELHSFGEEAETVPTASSK